MIKHPRQLVYYLRPHKIVRVFYYLRHGGLAQVSRVLDERLLLGTDMKLDINIDKPIHGKKIDDYPVLEFKREMDPLVSICIPAYNQFDYTYCCLRSILKNTSYPSYEIILADDCSTDLTSQIYRVAKNISVIRTPSNFRFLKNCNYAAKYAKGRYLLFLNNDTQVQKNWLSPLVRLMEAYPQAGMTGSKLVYPNGSLQEAGGIIWKDASAWNFGNGNNPALPEYNYVKPADYISGASIMIRRQLWEQIGGFDERFAPAYYEDSDLAFEVRAAGYEVVFQPESVVVHFEGISNGTDIASGIKANQLTNQQKFYNKWKKILLDRHFENAVDPFLCRDRSQYRKRILIIDHMVPRYDRDAGAKNVFMYTKMFVDMGIKVTFLPADFFPYQPYAKELEQYGVEILYGNYYFKYWKEWLKENIHYFDYIYLNRPHISIRFISLIKEYGKGKIIYFGHDLHYLREQREYEVNGNPELLESARKWKKIEFQLIEAADVVYVVGNYEQATLQKEFPQKLIRNIPIFTYEPLTHEKTGNISDRDGLLFVGGFNHPPNVDAVLWFAREIFPKIQVSYPAIVWYIVGSNPTDEILALANEHIIVTGFISDDELSRYYQQCRLAVVPLRYGAGVKGKVIESIYHQCPLITTPVGAEGISTSENVFEIADADATMADAIIRLYGDLERLQVMADGCASYINQYYTKRQALNVINMDIQTDAGIL